eukprot:SAG22_NODE_1950_length_3271_cov_3.362547_3_plen_117_part_01
MYRNIHRYSFEQSCHATHGQLQPEFEPGMHAVLTAQHALPCRLLLSCCLQLSLPPLACTPQAASEREKTPDKMPGYVPPHLRGKEGVGGGGGGGGGSPMGGGGKGGGGGGSPGVRIP